MSERKSTLHADALKWRAFVELLRNEVNQKPDDFVQRLERLEKQVTVLLSTAIAKPLSEPANPPRPKDGFVKTKYVLERYSISAQTLKRWVKGSKKGFPQPMVMGNRWYFRNSELDRWDHFNVD